MQHRPEHFARQARRRSRSRRSSAARRCRAGTRPAAAAGGSRRPPRRIASTCARIVSRASAVITGPTSVASRSGLPIASSSIAPISMVRTRVGDILLHAQDAQRRTTLPGAVEGGGQHVRNHLFRQRRAVDDHRVLPAGFGDQRDRPAIRRQALGELALDEPRNFGRPGEHDAAHARIGDQSRADAHRRRAAAAASPAARPPRAGCAPPGPRSAAFPRPAWPAPHCPPPAPPRPGR